MSMIIHGSQVPAQMNAIMNILQKSGIIVYPTETLYGIGGDAFNYDAYKKIGDLKKRDPAKPMLMLIESETISLELTADHHDIIHKISTCFWPGALTLVARASTKIPKWLISEDGKIAFRVSNHPIALMITQSLKKPLISTSANFAGTAPCSSIQQARHLFKRKIDIYIDGGKLSGLSSTIIDISTTPITIVREGVLPVAQIRKKLPGIF